MPNDPTPRQRKRRIETELRQQRRRHRRHRPGSKARKEAAAAIDSLVRRLAAVEALLRKIARAKPRSGTGAWGGSQSIFENEVFPVTRAAGFSPTSTKRRETYGNPGSDHHVSQALAFAADFPTANNRELAQRVARRLGLGTVSEYTAYYIKRAGRTFRVQFIWSTHGTGPHLHIGIERVG